MSRINIKAVLVGFAVDFFGSLLVGIVMAAVLVVMAVSRHASPAAMAAMRRDVVPELIGLLGTTLSTLLGGYVAGRLSYPASLLNAGAVGCISLVLAISLAALFPGVAPLWKLVAGGFATLPAALCGGWAAAKRRPARLAV